MRFLKHAKKISKYRKICFSLRKVSKAIERANSFIGVCFQFKVKMKFVLCHFLLAFFLLQSITCITIEIEPEDIVHVSEILQSIIENGPNPVISQSGARKMSFSIMKRGVCGVIKLFGVLLTLVGANILTTKIEKSPEKTIITAQNNSTALVITAQNNSTALVQCIGDFGCSANLCWKVCDTRVGNNAEKPDRAWCFTSSNKSFVYHACTHAYECSACWECSNPCMV